MNYYNYYVIKCNPTNTCSEKNYMYFHSTKYPCNVLKCLTSNVSSMCNCLLLRPFQCLYKLLFINVVAQDDNFLSRN